MRDEYDLQEEEATLGEDRVGSSYALNNGIANSEQGTQGEYADGCYKRHW